MRGRTIQNCVSAFSKLAASSTIGAHQDCFVIRAQADGRHVPTVTSRYLTSVLPTWTPSPLKKLIVICGPGSPNS